MWFVTDVGWLDAERKSRRGTRRRDQNWRPPNDDDDGPPSLALAAGLWSMLWASRIIPSFPEHVS